MRYMREDESSPAAIDSTLMFMDYVRNPDEEFEQKISSVMDLKVRKISKKKPITISVNASIEDACQLLSEAGVKKVPVVDDNKKVVGIISRSAVTRYLTKRYLEQTETAKAISK